MDATLLHSPRLASRAVTRFRALYMLGLLALVVGLGGGCKSESKRKADIRRRGPGSQEAWMQATGGRYDGNLPDE